jgi:hypothetical protein
MDGRWPTARLVPSGTRDEGSRPRRSADLAEGASPAAAAVVALQRSAGNRAVAGLLSRQPAPNAPPAPAPDPAPTWEKLHSRFQDAVVHYAKLNEKDVIRGERVDLLSKLQKMWAELGAPGEATADQLKALSRRLDEFEDDRAEEYMDALESWPVLEEEYKLERARLVASPEVSDWHAAEYLDASHQLAVKRKAAAGDDLRLDDIAVLMHEMASEAYLEKGWQKSLRETIDTAEASGGQLRAWPWPEFKATQLLVEGAALGPHQAIKSAIRYQVRHAVAVMIEMGESEANARAWADRALKAADEASDHVADRLAKKVGTPKVGSHKWAHRLHIAGKLTIAVDVIGSTIDILAAPPKERPKKIIVHASRIAGGLAGAGAGARVGAKLGARFGPVGAAVGGIGGAIAGGFLGAWGAKKIATFFADEIWPPEDTYDEPVGGP